MPQDNVSSYLFHFNWKKKKKNNERRAHLLAYGSLHGLSEVWAYSKHLNASQVHFLAPTVNSKEENAENFQ